MEETYTKDGKKNLYSCYQFAIQFPDEYILEPDEKYGFYAYLKNPDDENTPLISIKPGRSNPLPSFGMEVHSQSLLLAVIWLSALKGVGGLLWVSQRAKSFNIKTQDGEYLCFYDITNNTAVYYVYLVFHNTTRPLTITIANMDDSKDAEGKAEVEKLLSHLKVKQPPYDPLPSLLDPKFTTGELIASVAENWKELLASYAEELEHLFYIDVQITQQFLRRDQKAKTYSKEAADRAYRENLRHYAENVETLLGQTADYLQEIYDKNQDNPVFYQLVADMENFILKLKKVSFSIDHVEKTENVRNADMVRAKWHYCILLRNKKAYDLILADLEAADRENLESYSTVSKQHDDLMDHLKELETQLAEEKKRCHEETEHKVDILQKNIDRKEQERKSNREQQHQIKQEISQLSFFHRSQKEQLNRQLSALFIRHEGIISEIESLEKQKSYAISQEGADLGNIYAAINSYRLRLELKNEELDKAYQKLETNRARIDAQSKKYEALNQEFRETQVRLGWVKEEEEKKTNSADEI